MSARFLITSNTQSNPFFLHDLNTLCAICHRELGENRSHSIFSTIPNLEPSLTAFQVLESFSNFNTENGPQNMCTTCFHNTTSAYKFMLICNKAQQTIQYYFEQQDNLRTMINENDCQVSEDIEILVVTEDAKPEVKEEIRRKSSLSANDGRVKCNVCHKMYMHGYIREHMRTHTGEKPFQCEICSKSFTSSSSLHLHQTIHSDNRPYICKFCGRRFKLLRILRGHERTHTGEKPYKCTTCDKSFARPASLKTHYLVHTKEKPFQCEICSKTFGRKDHLKIHLASHSDVKKHECHLCGNRFTLAYSLRTHLITSCQGRRYLDDDADNDNYSVDDADNDNNTIDDADNDNNSIDNGDADNCIEASEQLQTEENFKL